MGEDPTRGIEPGPNREVAAPSGWVTTQQAARALGISPRTVRWHIEQGNLGAEPHGKGVRRTWYVAIDSLQEFRDKRQHDADTPQTHRVLEESADIAADSLGNPIRELALRIAEEAGRAAEYRVRLELTEQAQSSLEEELAEERIRREQAEQRVAELEGRLRALVAPREASREKAPEEPSGTQIPPEEERRSWWRRLIGG